MSKSFTSEPAAEAEVFSLEQVRRGQRELETAHRQELAKLKAQHETDRESDRKHIADRDRIAVQLQARVAWLEDRNFFGLRQQFTVD